VANFVFQGANALAMDAKGRLAVPTRHREVLQALCGGSLTITRNKGCLVIYPRPEWESVRERVAALPMEATAWKRMYLGNAMDVDIDSAGRILVSPELRAAAKLDKAVTLLGMGSHFELWDTPTHLANEEALAATAESEMPDSVKGLSL